MHVDKKNDKFALMTMIISSFDDWLNKGGNPKPQAERLRKLLLTDFATHEYRDMDMLPHLFDVAGWKQLVRDNGIHL